MNKQENKLYDIYEFNWIDSWGFISHASVAGDSPREGFGFLERRLREKGCKFEDLIEDITRIKRPKVKADKKGVICGYSYYNEVHL
jgi:hypothetical protein